jgi:uncharacterized protein YggE
VVGNPLKIELSGGFPSPQPKFMGRAMAAAPMPVAAGEQELTVSVSIVYELKSPK